MTAARETPGLDTAIVDSELLLDLEGITVALPLSSLTSMFWGLPEREWMVVAHDHLATLLSLGDGGPLESELLPRFLTPSRMGWVEPETIRLRVEGLPHELVFVRSSGLSRDCIDEEFVRRRGFSPAQVLAQGRVGVRHLVPPREQIRGLVAIHSVDEDAATAVLAIPAMLRGDDELAAVAPAHDTLLLWESDDYEAALEARSRLGEIEDEEAPLASPVVITCAGIEPVSWSELDGSAVEG